MRYDADLRCHRYEILQAHYLRDRGGHFRHKAGCESGESFGAGLLAEKPVAEFADCEVNEIREGGAVEIVNDQARDFVGLIRDQQMTPELAERQVGQSHLRGDAFFGGVGRDTGQIVAGARGGGARQQRLQVVKSVRDRTDGVGVAHATPRSTSAAAPRGFPGSDGIELIVPGCRRDES
jgi:hypothetical protein